MQKVYAYKVITGFVGRWCKPAWELSIEMQRAYDLLCSQRLVL